MKTIISWIFPIFLFCISCENVRDNDLKQAITPINVPNEKLSWKPRPRFALTKNINKHVAKVLKEVDPVYNARYYSKLRFSMFPVDKLYNGKLANPNLKTCSSGSTTNRVYVDACHKNGVNFAGHFTIVELDCGCMCTAIAVVDRISGKIFAHQVFDAEGGHFGMRYRINSTMIILDSEWLDEMNYWDHSAYYRSKWPLRPSIYEWRDSIFVKLD